MRALEPQLRQGLADLKLSLDDAQVASLLDYLDLIQKWNKVYNLTAVRETADMLTHHLLDSLAVIAPLRLRLSDLCGGDGGAVAGAQLVAAPPVRLLDVGSGAGLPGVVVAICCPDIMVDCVDAVAKKVAFVRQVAASLGLPNLRGLHQRVESLTGKYDLVCSRAFASLPDFARWSETALAPEGVWMALKGKYPEQEILALPEGIRVFHVEHLAVPGLDAQRCIVWMRRA
ncbi:MAG: 16S rRNA (guanine(527)-N(7))-methyltransferase RsmG [Rhodoferax sp.]